MSYLDEIKEKRLMAAKMKETQDSITELRKIRENTSSAKVVLANKADVQSAIADHSDRLSLAISELNNKKYSVEQTKILSALESSIEEIKKGNFNKLDKVIETIEKLNINPNITVQSPEVTVDMSSLETTLREVFMPPNTSIDLASYRAQDILDMGDKQYVGFMKPDGHWYIIENHIKNNTMRYLFGKTNYASAFKKASQYKYHLLDEAVNASAS